MVAGTLPSAACAPSQAQKLPTPLVQVPVRSSRPQQRHAAAERLMPLLRAAAQQHHNYT